jgi:DNA topoisomerase-1
MKKKLLIVESPHKAINIKKMLGRGYDVIASVGHVRDLPKSKIGVDIENNFEPNYITIRGKADVIKNLKESAQNSSKVYLATDPDREGEAISWHLSQMLGLDINDENRVTFNEITKSGVQKGMESPRKIDMDLVDAQQARRVLDRIVGYKLSPFLWKKVRPGLSAGRVQSVAVKMIVDRENEIRNFMPDEYWTIEAKLFKDLKKNGFVSKFYGTKNGKKVAISNETEANKILDSIKDSDYKVTDIKKGERKKSPAPPFITSTLQQEASRKLNFTSKRTMKAAQELYEGVNDTGLITYMRTDSLRISEEARKAGTDYITETYGKKYLPEKPRYFKSKSSAQDAHEAIRPTIIDLTPAKAKDSLSADQYKLYKLIWERFIASLMANAVYDTENVDIVSGDYLFKASGFRTKFDGFTTLYTEGLDDGTEEKETALPPLSVGDELNLDKITPSQHFTEPPARYTEATLIKAFEDTGVGRPSTYAPTIATILSREYVEKSGKSLMPTPLGEVVTGIMNDHFEEIVDIDFTANMEKSLDNIESGDKEWKSVVGDFYEGFSKTLNKAEEKIGTEKVKVPDVETDEVCELCGRKMVIKSGRFGKFLACPGYPECKNTRPIVENTEGECPICGSKILTKKSKRGYKFFGCSSYPTCNFMTWDEPTKKKCPTCGKTLFKKKGNVLHCLGEGCGYEEKIQKGKKK